MEPGNQISEQHENKQPISPIEQIGDTSSNNMIADIRKILTTPQNILTQIKNEFPEPTYESIIPIDKFIPYLDSLLLLYQNDTTGLINTYLTELQKHATTLSIALNIDVINQIIDNLFNIDNTNENYNKLLHLLRANRYIIYTSQYISLIHKYVPVNQLPTLPDLGPLSPPVVGGDNPVVKEQLPQAQPDPQMIDIYIPSSYLIDNVNTITGKKEYFNIYNLFVIDCILSELGVFGEDSNLNLLIASLELQNTKSIENNVNTLTKFITYVENNIDIKKTYLLIHGAPGIDTYVVPDNKILVILTPFNRVGFSNPNIKTALEWMLSPDNISSFIASPICFIDKFIANQATMDPTSEPGLNGAQIFYSGHTYIDIELSINKPDFKFGFGSYDLVNDKFKNDGTIHDKNVPLNTTLHTYFDKLDKTIPEIVILYCCRSANETIPNGMIELTYRYNKIHNLITDNIGLCYNPKTEIPILYPSPFTLNFDYTKQYMKYHEIPIPDLSTLSINSAELESSLFKNTALTPIRQKDSLALSSIKEKAFYTTDITNLSYETYVTININSDIQNIADFFRWNPPNFIAKLHDICTKLSEHNADMHRSYGYVFFMILDRLLNYNYEILCEIVVNLITYLQNEDYVMEIITSSYGIIDDLLVGIVDKLCNKLDMIDNIPEDDIADKQIKINNVQQFLNILVTKFTNSLNLDNITSASAFVLYVNNPTTNQPYNIMDLNDINNGILFTNALTDSKYAINHIGYLEKLINYYIGANPYYALYIDKINSLINDFNHPLVSICYNLFTYMQNPNSLFTFSDNTEKYKVMLKLVKYIKDIYKAYSNVNQNSVLEILIDENVHPVYTVIEYLGIIRHKIGLNDAEILPILLKILDSFIELYQEFDLLKVPIHGPTWDGNAFDAILNIYFNTKLVYVGSIQKLINGLTGLIDTYSRDEYNNKVELFKTYLSNYNTSQIKSIHTFLSANPKFIELRMTRDARLAGLVARRTKKRLPPSSPFKR